MTVETRRSFCRVCHAACPVDIDVDLSGGRERAVAVRGVPDDPLFEGYTCIKGRQLADQHHHPARLRSILRRGPEGFEPVDPEVAFGEMGERLRAIVTEHGPRAVASYTGTGGYQSSCAVPVARAFHKGLGSPSFYTSVTIDQPAKATAPSRLGTWEGGYHGFTGADVLLAIGYNPMVSSYGPPGGLQGTNPFTVMRRAKAEGLRLVVVDPRRTELAAFADVFLQVRPGEDAALLAGMLNVVLAEGLHDRAFCAQWVEQLAELEAAVAPFTAPYVAERCGIDEADLLAATRLFAGGRRGTAGTGTGPGMAPHSGLTEHLVLTLNTVLGRVNREGETMEPGWFLAPELPRRAQVVAPRPPAGGPPTRFRGLRGYAGEMPTTTLAEEILTPGEGRVRALVVSGGNPVVAWPDHELTVRAMEDLELLVVIDHRMSATAELAHYVVPPRLSLERADVPHIMDMWFRAPYTNYTPAVLAPEGDTFAEWEVFWNLARRLGSPIRLAGGELPFDRRPTDDEVLDLAYARARMPVAEMRGHRGEVHPGQALVVQPADPACTARFAVAPADVVAELGELRTESSSAVVLPGFTPDAYPFRLVSRRLKTVLNSLGTELPALRAKGTTNHAHMHPDDLVDLGLTEGDLVEITSPRASLTGVVAAAPDVRRGVVSMAHAWGGTSATDEKVRDIGAPTNRLVSTEHGHDPVTGMVVQSAIPVRVVRATTVPA
jgi:anaerobic selenocysteine-containing dehydrogenase